VPSRLTSQQRLFYACALAATLVFGFAISRPLEWLLGVVPDDAFYYLQIARKIATTGESTFDGIHPTNGYHPAWMAVLVLVAKVFTDPVALIRAGAGAAFVFHLAASRVMVAALSRLIAPGRAWVAGALWVINPLPMNLALQAMESAIYIFAGTVALLTYAVQLAPRVADGQAPSLKAGALFGLSLGFLFLGRTESVVITTVVTGLIAYRLRRNGGFTLLVVTTAAFLLVVLPWFAYSHFATGSWFQRSGSMKMLWAAAYPTPPAQKIYDVLRYVLGAWITFPIVGIPGGWGNDLRAVIDAVALAILVWLMVRGLRQPETRVVAIPALVLLAACFATGLVYGFFFSEMQYWYKSQPSLICWVVGFGVAAEVVMRYWPSRARLLVGASVVVLGLALIGRFVSLSSYPHQRDVYATQAKFDAIVPDGELIGCFNAGIPGYFSQRTIVNLDGLVNNTLFPYYKRKEFDVYLRDARVRYIVDEEIAVERGKLFTKQPLQLTEVAKEPMPSWHSGYRVLWKVENP
jgi:hypothetical protein